MSTNPLLKVPLPSRMGRIKESFHIAFYHAAKGGYQDRISKCLLDFNAGQEPQTSRWIKLASPLVGGQLEFDCVVRALRSRETAAEPSTPLQRLGEAIAKEKGVPFAPERLRKNRATSELRALIGKPARQKELAGAYSFDGSGLPAKVRILVIDDVMVTGATTDTIEAAIHAALPEAEISCFVLGRAHLLAPNSHLNPEYFTSEREDTPPLMEPAVQAGRSPGHPPAPAHPPVARNLTDRFPRALRQSDEKEKSRFWIYVSVLALVFLIAGSLIAFTSGERSASDDDLLPEINALADGEAGSTKVNYAPPAGTLAAEPEPPESLYPQGIVVVPGVGLRTKPAVDAAAIPEVALRNGEKVSVVRRHSPGDGPSWVQVQTKSGMTGWVFASLIRVPRNSVD